MSRRTFLAGAGAALVLVAAGGAWRAADQGVFDTGEGPAYVPWERWRGDNTAGPLALIPAAILAANAHNTQPWLFRVGDAHLDLFADQGRSHGAADPLRREQLISLGCALENLILAAEAHGYTYRLMLMPDSAAPAHIARLDLLPAQARPSPLYEAIPHRHTNRFAYDTGHPVPAAVLANLAALNDEADVRLSWFASQTERERVGTLTVAATEAFIADAEQSGDSNAWYRHDWDEIQRKRDGITLDASGSPDLFRAIGKLLPGSSREQNDRTWLAATRDRQVPTAAAFGIIAARDARASAQRVKIGRIWQRLHLWGTVEGLAMQPLNQINERADREVQLGLEPKFGAALQALVGDLGWQGAFVFRIGYPMATGLKSPRRPVADVLA